MLVTLKEYAEIVGLSYGSIRNAVTNGTFVPDEKRGQHWYVDSERKYPHKKRGYLEGNHDSHSRLNNIWRGMKRRCSNPNYGQYKNYGGRGIKVCDEWNNEYIAFRDWALSHGYEENLTLDRIDNDGNYEPNNCQWITKSENSKKQWENKSEKGMT